MSDEYFKEIAEQVKSGEYFRDAREWYRDKYLGESIQRSYFVLYGVIAVVLMLFAWLTLAHFSPLKIYRPMLITIPDETEQYTVFKSLGDRGNVEEDPHPPVQKYLLEQFIEAYESYDFRNDFQQLKRNGTLIAGMATENVVNTYRSLINTSNPESPVLRLRNKAILTAVLIPESFAIQRVASVVGQEDKGAAQYTATVDFFLQETNISGTTRAKWRAKIDFTYNGVRYDKETKDFSTMEFKVTNYASEKAQ